MNSVWGDVAIYCLFKPTAGETNITGTYPSNPAEDWVSVFTLAGVSTMTAPLTGTAGGAANTNLTFAVTNVPDGAFAVLCGLWSQTNGTGLNLQAASGTMNAQYDSADDGAAVAMGTVSGLSNGTPSFSYSVDPSDGAAPMAFAGAVFYPVSSAPLSAANSTITPSSLVLPANGANTATITVQAVDTNGVGMEACADTVTLKTTAGSLGTVTDNGDGSYTAMLTISPTNSETATITGTINGGVIGHPATVTFTGQSFSPGFLKLEVYLNCPGYTVDDLRACANYPANPDAVYYVPQFEVPTAKYIPGNVGGIPEGERLSGFIVPAETTNYMFYLSANLAGELWLSTDDTPANLQLIATGNQDHPARTWDLTGASGPISLVAGRRYCVEALQKDDPAEPYGYQEELMAVTWTTANAPAPENGTNPISGQFLGILTATDTTPPAAVTNLVVNGSDIGASWVWVEWSAPSEPGTTNPVALYDLRYSTQPITSSNWAGATPVDLLFYFGQPAGAAQQVKVTSLTQGTPYYFAIRSEDAAGNWSPLSNIALGTTLTVPPGGFDAIWDLEFNVAGADPTAAGDWINRKAPLPAGTTWADLVTNGWLTVGNGWNPILDTKPNNNFTNNFIVEERCRCLDVVNPPDPGGWSGANFFVNLDTRPDGFYSQFSCALALLADGTQELYINIDNNLIATYPGLSDDFHVIRLEFDTANTQFATFINTTNLGTQTYTRNMNGNTGPSATILGWAYSAQWDYIRIGVPLPPGPPTLQITRTGNSLSLSWPVAATGFTLQKTSSLSPASWSNAGVSTVQGNMNVFTTTIGSVMQFYRLTQGNQ